MPRIFPTQNKEVIWNENEGTIGVVGVAPWATLDFCHKVYALSKATKDWHYPRLLVDANSKIPSRGRYFDLGEQNPAPIICQTINELAKAGATIAVVPCNTAHILVNEWKNADIPIVNIIDATMAKIPARTTKIAVLGSRYLAAHKTYENAAKNADLAWQALSNEEQNIVNQAINALKQSPHLEDALAASLQALATHLQERRVEAVLLACTELSLLTKHPLWGNLAVVDSNEALAEKALQAIHHE